MDEYDRRHYLLLIESMERRGVSASDISRTIKNLRKDDRKISRDVPKKKLKIR